MRMQKMPCTCRYLSLQIHLKFFRIILSIPINLQVCSWSSKSTIGAITKIGIAVVVVLWIRRFPLSGMSLALPPTSTVYLPDETQDKQGHESQHYGPALLGASVFLGFAIYRINAGFSSRKICFALAIPQSTNM